MSNSYSFANNTSANLEKIAIDRYRTLITNIPQECRVFRELWGNSTVLCLDFVECPDQLESTLKQSLLLLVGLEYLGLGNAIIFRINQKVIKWVNLGRSN